MGEIIKVTSSLIADSAKSTINSQSWVASEKQTLFTLSSGNKYNPGNNQIEVYIHGVKQVSGTDFQETSSTSFTLNEAVPAGALIEAQWIQGLIPYAVGHNETHRMGGTDELPVDTLKNYKEQIKDKIDKLNTDVGNISNLNTTNKTNVVSAVNENISKTNTKVEKAYVDTAYANVGTTYPKGAFATLADLRAAGMSGSTDVYLVLADNKIYSWSGIGRGGDWRPSTVYQSSTVLDNSINYMKADFMTTGKNLYDISSATVNGLDYNTGKPTPETIYLLSDFIPVTSGRNIYISTVGSGGIGRILREIAHKIVFYDVNKNLLLSVVPSINLNKNYVLSGTSYASAFSIPSNVAYMRFTMSTGFLNSAVQLEYDAMTDSFESFVYKIPRLDLSNTVQSLQTTVSGHDAGIASITSNTATAADVTTEETARTTADTNHANSTTAHQVSQIAYDSTTTAKQKLDNMQNQITNLASGAAPTAGEITDARTGADNTARASLGAIVREMHAQQLNAASQTKTITHGSSIVGSVVQSTTAKPTVYGKTLINLMGSFGSFEKDSNYDGLADGWSKGDGCTVATQTTNAMFGSYSTSLKCTVANGNTYIERNVMSQLNAGKYYLAMVSIPSGTAGGIMWRFLDTNVGGTLTIAKTGTNTSGAAYVKISPSDYSLLAGAGFTHVRLLGNNVSVGNTTYFDGVRMYEIDQVTYNKIDVDPEYTGDKLVDKYPYVEGIKHIQGATLRKVGKNLLQGFPNILHSEATSTAPYALTINTASTFRNNDFLADIVAGQTYTFTLTKDTTGGYGEISFLDANGSIIGSTSNAWTVNKTAGTYNTTSVAPAGSVKAQLRLTNNVSGVHGFSNWQLEINSVPTVFQPYNADYVYLPTTLASNVDDSIRDVAYEREGIYYKLRRWQTGYVLDGSKWALHIGATTVTGSKRAYVTSTLPSLFYDPNMRYASRLIRNDGFVINMIDPLTNVEGCIVASDGLIYASVPNASTGFGESYTPSSQEWKNYFNGWRMNSGTLGTLYDIKTTANFVGKVSGSTTENPHITKLRTSATSLITPSDSTAAELTAGAYANIQTLDGVAKDVVASTNLNIAQTLFSFNLIEHVLRKYGTVAFGSATTTADRVTWLKANLTKVTANWYGFGSGPAGNKAYMAMWIKTISSWTTPPASNTGNTPIKTVINVATNTDVINKIDDNGFVHFLAYADASDGVTASTIYTDFIELEVELNLTKYWTAIESPRANFIGKVSGSTVENPNIFKRTTTNESATTLKTPIQAWSETADQYYGWAGTLNGTTADSTVTSSGYIPQHMFSFNLIEHVLRKYGSAIFNGAVTTAERVTWLKANIGRINVNYYGYGSGPAGNKVTLGRWNGTTWGGSLPTNTTANIAKISLPDLSPNFGPLIDVNGMIHYLAYADASDGVTSSTLYTDFVDLEVELNTQIVPTTGLATIEFKPYTIDYVLSSPMEEAITGAEGEISLHPGSNYLELSEGVVVKERAIPTTSSSTTDYHLNGVGVPTVVDSPLKYRTNKILKIYKNDIDDTANWSFQTSLSYGGQRAYQSKTIFDTTAVYTVTYVMLDKYLNTANVVETKLEYASTAKAVQSINSQRIAETETKISTATASIAELYRRIKSLGG